jgi:hypothetical protein
MEDAMKEDAMKNLAARHIHGTDSLKRGVADGWYATSLDEVVCSGPFVTRAACEAHIERERVDIDAYHEGATNQH